MLGKLWALNHQVGINLKKKTKKKNKKKNNNTTLRPSDVKNTFLSPGPRPRTIKLLRNKTLIYIGIVNSCFSQICNRVMDLDSCQNLVFTQ